MFLGSRNQDIYYILSSIQYSVCMKNMYESHNETIFNLNKGLELFHFNCIKTCLICALLHKACACISESLSLPLSYNNLYLFVEHASTKNMYVADLGL